MFNTVTNNPPSKKENLMSEWHNIYENNKELSTHYGTAGTYHTLVHIDCIFH